MAIADDFSVAVNGDIRHVSGATRYRVLELHRFLQDLADNAATAGDDLLDIAGNNPSTRSTDQIITLNGTFNIDDTAAEYLYDGSVTQENGATVYSGLVVLGTVESGTELILVQDNQVLTSYWGTGLNTDPANNILLRILIPTRKNNVDIDGKRLRVLARELGDTYAEFNVTMGLGNAVAAVNTSVDLNNQTVAGTIATWASITNTEGLRLLDLDGNGATEQYYSEWNKGTQTINDVYERAKWIQRRGTAETIHTLNGVLFRGITHSLAYDNRVGPGLATNDTIAWGLRVNYDNEAGGPFQVGEAVWFNGSSAIRGRVLALDDDGLTGAMIVYMEAGAPLNDHAIAGQTSGATADVNGAPVGQATGGGRALLLAVEQLGASGNIYFQLLCGSAPVNDTVLYNSLNAGQSVDVNGAVTQRNVSPEFIGQSTGSAIIGAYGVGFEEADVTASDRFFDLTNTQRTPPNNVTFTVAGLVVGEDRVLVGPDDGLGALDLDQLSVATTALTGAAETSIEVGAPIPLDTPSSGTIRVQLNSGRYLRVEYTSYVGSVFTITSTDFSTDNANIGNNVFVSYIDKVAAATSESFTAVYQSDRSLVVRVRDGGVTPIVPFETTGTLGSSGGSVTAIRQDDV